MVNGVRLAAAAIRCSAAEIARALKTPPLNGQGAALTALTPNVSLAELEKHLDDYRKGRVQLSEDTAETLRDEDKDNAVQLGDTAPTLSRLYLGYKTAFGYEQRSRFVNGVNSALAEQSGMTAPRSSSSMVELQKRVRAYARSVEAESVGARDTTAA